MQNRQSTNLGGWKPSMLPDGINVMVNYKAGRKIGYYEATPNRASILRRVELPEWANDYINSGAPILPLIQARKIIIPENHTKERQGHILWSGRKFGLDSSAIGIDEEIVSDWIQAHACQEIVFVIYKFGKEEVERWRIDKKSFLAKSKRVETSSLFEPQHMISTSDLVFGGVSTNQSINNPFGNL